jgi:hypothetical protein
MSRYRGLVLAAALAGAGVVAAENLSGLAKGVLEHARMAQQAVAVRNSAAAADHIHQARALAAEVRKQAPPQPVPVMAAISQDIETTTTYRPVKPGKHGNEGSADRLAHNTSIREVERDTDTTYLNLDSADNNLQAAQAALANGDWAAAKGALNAVQESVVRKHTEGDLPLLKASDNLELARSRILNSQYQQATAPLRAAAQALSDYERLSPGPQVNDVAYMRERIEELAKAPGRQHGEMVAFIDDWLNTIRHWEKKGGVEVQ